MMLRKINGVAKANGLEDRVDIVISVFTLARNGKSNIDFTATELLKTFTHDSLVCNIQNICNLYVYFILL